MLLSSGEKKRKIEEGTEEEETTSKGLACVCLYCSLLRFRSVSFIRVFWSRREALFYGGRHEPPREKGWKGGDGGLKGVALLNQIARNKICILLRAIPEREFPSRPWKTPVCHYGGSNFPISFRDMNMTSLFWSADWFLHDEPIGRIKILTCIWFFKYSSILISAIRI